jgi:two-component system, OmpR family, alkaline phosphatase synthesis response regulator PhoP
MRSNVLFVEDEEALRMTVGDRLRNEGFIVDCAANGYEGFEKATHIPFDLIILDAALPNKSGFVVCREIREAGLITPILMLTARSRPSDKVNELKTDADYYVTKPFNMRELMTRVEALIGRAPSRPVVQTGVFAFGSVHVDLVGTNVTREGKAVNLSAREFQLLRYFIEHRDGTLSRDELLKQVWGYSADVYTHTVDVHVTSLRKKLEEDPERPKFILTMQGLGYKFAPYRRCRSCRTSSFNSVLKPSEQPMPSWAVRFLVAVVPLTPNGIVTCGFRRGRIHVCAAHFFPLAVQCFYNIPTSPTRHSRVALHAIDPTRFVSQGLFLTALNGCGR